MLNVQCAPSHYDLIEECGRSTRGCTPELTMVKSVGFCADKGHVMYTVMYTAYCLERSPVMAKLDNSHFIGHA